MLSPLNVIAPQTSEAIENKNEMIAQARTAFTNAVKRCITELQLTQSCRSVLVKWMIRVLHTDAEEKGRKGTRKTSEGDENLLPMQYN